MNNNKQIFEKINIGNPDVSGWYDTDKGNLFWHSGPKQWSCREDRISEEYPLFWLKPIPQQPEQDKCPKCSYKNVGNPSVCHYCGLVLKQPEQQADGIGNYCDFLSDLLIAYRDDEIGGVDVIKRITERINQAVQQERERVDSDLNKLISGNAELRNTIEQLQHDKFLLEQNLKLQEDLNSDLKSQLEQTKARKVKWPERKQIGSFLQDETLIDENLMREGWNMCIDEFKRLNPEVE